MSSSSALPPLGNLPSWSRVSTLDRSRYPKPFLRDRLQTLPPPGVNDPPNPSSGHSVDFKFLEDITPADQHRLLYYNKSIKFLQQQHSETLKKLHDEIDSLKRQNKDLQFQYIMLKDDVVTRTNSAENVKSVKYRRPSGSSNEEIQLLQEELKQAKAENLALHQAISDKMNSSVLQESGNKSEEELKNSAALSNGDDHDSNKSIPLRTTFDPLQVRDTPEDLPRTLSECQAFIKHLHKVNHRQTKELSKLRNNIQDIMSTREQPTMMRGSAVKSFSRENKSQSANESSKLPRVHLKKTTHRSMLQPSLSATEHVTLPALKNSMISNVADRRKRQQAILKARSKKDGQLL